MKNELEESKKLIAYLSPLEKKIIPFLTSGTVATLSETSGLDTTSVLRGLEFLLHKGIVRLATTREPMIVLGTNGVLYLKNGLPERRLLEVLMKKNSLTLKDAQRESGLADNEFKVSIGALKKKAGITLVNGIITLIAKKEEVIHKSLEENFLVTLPRPIEGLKEEEKYAFEQLKSRKDIVGVEDKKTISIEITSLGHVLMKESLDDRFMESVTPELINSEEWKEKKFRRYDLVSAVPKILGGKQHFVNQAIDYAKKIWLERGFREMTGRMVQSSFWNFDTLFIAQDHPVREMQDTFFLKGAAQLPAKMLVTRVKKAHEGSIAGSKGWQRHWNETEARRLVLRTHTTCLSVQTLVKIAEGKEFPAKYFAVGKCFRNETIDWSHGFEFNQTEGIVVDEHATFKQLIGYLTEFFHKMGHKKIRIRPGYFPYTEPSLEIDVFHPEHKKWVELGGAGMFRPEVTIPIFGKHIPVLAWGPGFDRIIMESFDIIDLRDMYKNDINQLREMKVWRT